MRQQTNLKDLLAFAKALDREEKATWGYDVDGFGNRVIVFRASYSIGFCRARVQPGDMIFAVDGVRTPLIVRRDFRTSSVVYNVIGECYLWAALELDYWNPGTHKGIWTSRLHDLGQVQTRMIEIY